MNAAKIWYDLSKSFGMRRKQRSLVKGHPRRGLGAIFPCQGTQKFSEKVIRCNKRILNALILPPNKFWILNIFLYICPLKSFESS
jgi:hypothetical protein